jgi:hypothetical protein
MFCLSLFFGALHFVGVAAQVTGMVEVALQRRVLPFGVQSSMLMGHLYLMFLAAYVGPKEFLRWRNRTDDEVLSPSENRKVTRGLCIVVGWAAFAGMTTLLWEAGLVAEVPETLLYTLGEVVAIFCGTEVSKYLRARQAVQGRQDASLNDNYADQVLDYAREHGGIDRPECQHAFGLTEDQSYRLLKRLVREKKLAEFGENKGRRYKLP